MQTGHNLFSTEPGFPIGEGPDAYEDLIDDFKDAVAMIPDITLAQDVVNKVFK